MEKRKATIIFDDEDVKALTKQGKEKSHTVQVRESTYKSLKLIAFKNDMKIVDLIDYLLIKSMKDSANKGGK